MDLIPNDWKYKIWKEISQKSFFNIFCFSNKGIRKIKDFQKLLNNEIYFTLQSNKTKYTKFFNFISWPNFMEGYHNFVLDIWSKIFTDWFAKCSDGYTFSSP